MQLVATVLHSTILEIVLRFWFLKLQIKLLNLSSAFNTYSKLLLYI